MQHLMIIAIGPVQEFIASARRSRDLWFSSWLLSALSKTAAREIARRHGIKSLIFPAPKQESWLDLESGFDVANKIFASVDCSPEEARQLATDVRNAVIDTLLEIGQRAYENVHGEFYAPKAEAQLRDLVEFYWVAVPFETADYGRSRLQLESSLAALKNTRDFAPTDAWAGTAPKSSLDGQRESVIPEKAYPPGGIEREQRNVKLRQLRRRYGVRDGERLCGVGLLKRHGLRGDEEEERFFSTSHVAALTLINRMTEADKRSFDQYIDRLRALGLKNEELGKVPSKAHPVFDRFDGHLLFEERLGELLTPEHFDNPAHHDEALKCAKQALKAFLETFEERLGENIQPVFPYYALIHADGDYMREVLGRITVLEKHRELSGVLTEFADSARSIVNEAHGSLVYAGGDDVLAFVPVFAVLDCARQLAEKFKDTLSQLAWINNGASPPPSLSVGIAVAHHLEPLADALAMVRNAEKEAKKVKGKNALAITISKRSGVDRIVRGSWKHLDRGQNSAGWKTFYGRLQKLIEMHRRDEIPDGAAYELRDLHLRLHVPESDGNHKTLQEAMRWEAVRILQRKEGERDEKRQMLEKLVNAGPANQDGTEKEVVDEQTVDVGQVADELIVARTFAQAMDIAFGPLEAETISERE